MILIFLFLTSLSMTDSGFIHTTTKDPIFFPFYGCVIFHCLYAPHLLYSFICQWTFRLLSYPGYCQQGCNEHWGTCIFLNYGFLRVYAQ